MHAGGDVVADQAHPFEAVDAPFGGFVGVPVLDRDSRQRIEPGFPAQRHYDVDVAGQRVVHRRGHLGGDVHADLEKCSCREAVDGRAGCGARRMNLHGVTGQLAHQSGGHL